MIRRCIRSSALLVIGLTWWIVVVAAPAHAYIDPGSGSFIIQILIGTALGLGLAIATFWRRLRAFFGRIFSRNRT